jgi:ATP sulfurylase
MRKLQNSTIRRLAFLAMFPFLALGPIGCGPEAITTVFVVATTAGAVAFTINQFQQIESVQLENHIKRLRIKGMNDGVVSTVEKELNDDEYRKVVRSGKVSLNGKLVPVSR